MTRPRPHEQGAAREPRGPPSRVEATRRLGIGGGGGVYLRHDGPRSLNAVVPGAGAARDLSTGGLLLDGSLAADYRIVFSHSDTNEGFMLIGLRAGYTFAPVTGDWEVDGRNLGGGPDLGITGPTVRLVIGAGGQQVAR